MPAQAMTPEPNRACGCLASPCRCRRRPTAPWMSADLQTTQNGTCASGRKFSAYFEYSSDQTCCKECITIPLKSGDQLSMTWNRLGGQGAAESAYVDTWMPGGAGGVFSFLPRVNLESIPVGGQRVYSNEGSLSFAFTSPGTPQAQLPIAAEKDTTYFTSYDQITGVYFEYFGGDLPSTDARYGRVNRRYDSRGNTVQYNYTANAGGEALLRSLSGDVTGNLVPSFHYADETIDATHFAPLTKIFLEDQVDASRSRTVYFEYTDYQDAVTLDTFAYLSRIIKPDGCTDQYDPIVPFNDITDVFQIKRDVDPEGFQTYFHYTGGSLDQVAEPEGRITYYEYPSSSVTHQISQGRPKRFLVNNLDAFGDQLNQVTQHTDPLGNTAYFEYNAAAARVEKKIDPNGNVTYYEYTAGADSEFAVTLQVSESNGARTYFGYDAKTYDLTKQVGPRFEPGTNIEVTYFRYDASRNRTAMVDALGDTTLFGPDAEGHLLRKQDPRGNVTYFNYGSADGSLESRQDALGDVTYFGYDSYRNQTAAVSPRWVEEADFAPFTTYHEYDELNRRTKTIDAQDNVTYFDWTSRSDLMAQVDARGTETAHTYDGLRLRTRTTVTDLSGTKLTETLDGYDTFMNRVRTQDGLGNVTYFVYDDIDRMTSEKDALGNASSVFYDSVGNRTEQVDERGNTTYFFYDLLSRRTVTRDALANPSYFFYDLSDNPSVSRDARGSSSYFFYDDLNRQESTRDALGQAAYFFYDPAGNQSVTVDVRENPTYFGYDALNRQSQIEDALGNATYFAYDARGNQTRVIDAQGNASTSAFDTLDRLEASADALGNATYFFYDPVGNQTERTDARGETTYFFFDGLKRQTEIRDALGNAAYFFYDLESNQTVTRNARAFSTYFGYDALNRQSRMEDALGNVTYFAYDAVGNQDRVIDARGNGSGLERLPARYRAGDHRGRRRDGAWGSRAAGVLGGRRDSARLGGSPHGRPDR